MDLSDLLSPEDIFESVRASSKKQLLQDLCDKASLRVNMPSRAIFDTLLQRERLGSTGVGNGIAIPHGKLPGLSGISGMFVRLEKPIDFDALDDQPVDLVFLLLAPEGAGADHLKALARIARVMREDDIVEKIRQTSDRQAIYSFLTENRASHAA